MLSFELYYLSTFANFKSVLSLPHAIHRVPLRLSFFAGLGYITRRASSLKLMNTVNSYLQLLTLTFGASSLQPVFLNICLPLVSFFFNYSYLFSQFYERVNKKIYKFSNYKIDRIIPKLAYIRPFNRVRHLVRLFHKSSLLLKAAPFTKRLLPTYLGFFFSKVSAPAHIALRQIQSLVFSHYKSTIFLK